MKKTRQIKLRAPRSQREVLPEYGFGGWFKEKALPFFGDMGAFVLDSTLSTVGAGNVVGDNWYSSKQSAGAAEDVIGKFNKVKNAVANVAAPGSGAVLGGLQGFNTDKNSEDLRYDNYQNNYMLKSRGATQNNSGSSVNNYTNMWSAAMGGVVPGGKANVSLERNEVTMGPDGTMKKFNLPPHPNNSRIPLEEGTIVFSDNPKLRMPDGRLPARAAAALKRQKDPAQKILDNPNSPVLARKSAERVIANADKELGRILNFQVSKTMELGGQNKTAGAVTEADWGTVVKSAGDWFKSDAGKSALSNAAALAPVMYNIGRGNERVEQLNPAAFQSPMAYGALQSMRNRVPNITPALQSTDESMAIANANLRSTATGRGQYTAGSVALANAGMKQKASIYTQGSQMQNQYLGEYGQMQAGLGQRMADTNLMISDLNSRNQAAGRNYGAAAAGQLSQWSQVQQQMNNQKNRDQQFMERYTDFMNMFEQGRSTGVGVSPVSTGNIQAPSFNLPTDNTLRPWRR